MNLITVLYLIIMAVGIYMTVSALKMKKSKEISPIVLAPEELKKCSDKEGFIAFLYWRAAIFGLILVIVAALCVANERLGATTIVKAAEMVCFLIAFGWFWYSLKQAREKFMKNF